MSSSKQNNQQKVLYWNIGSQPGRAVKALVDIGKVECKLVSIDLMTRQQKSKQFLQKYPLGKIPFFTKGNDIKIGQSNAIMIYLYQTEPTIPRYYYSDKPSQKAKINQYLSWYQGYFRMKMFKPIIMFLGSALMGKPIYENQKEEAMKEVHEALAQLDKLIGIEWARYRERHSQQNSNNKENNNKNSKLYVCGTQQPTIADLLIFFEVTNFVYFGIDQNQYKNISSWFKNVYGIQQVKTITHQWYPIGKQMNEMFSNIQVVKSKL